MTVDPKTALALALCLGSGTALAAIAPHDPEDGHPHHHHRIHDPRAHLLTIDQVLALEQNRALDAAPRATATGRSGDGDLTFAVTVRSEALPKKVFETNVFAGENARPVLDYAHGGFAYDHREGKGEAYWFLQGAGILRIQRDRSKIELLETDPEMLALNMHNATFFEHGGEAMIAWPANSGQRVFVTDTDGKLLHTIGRPTVEPYSTTKTGYSPTDTAYLEGLLWVTDGYGSKYVMSYDLEKKEWTGTIFGGKTDKPEPGKFNTNHGITIHDGMLWVSGRFFARIHSYKPDTTFGGMFPLPEGSAPCDFEFFVLEDKLYGVAASLNASNENKQKGDQGAAIYIVDMESLKIVATVKPKDELGLNRFTHLHNVFPVVEDGAVTLFCQAWNPGDFAILRQVKK